MILLLVRMISVTSRIVLTSDVTSVCEVEVGRRMCVAHGSVLSCARARGLVDVVGADVGFSTHVVVG